MALASLTQNNGKAAAVKTPPAIPAARVKRSTACLRGNQFQDLRHLDLWPSKRPNAGHVDEVRSPAQAQAFSPIALSGTAGGLGDTQSNRLDNSIKYTLARGPCALLAYIHGFGSDGYVPQNSNEFGVGGDMAGFSMDALYGVVHGEVAAASLSAANIIGANTPPCRAGVVACRNTLAATVSDNTGYSVQTSYNAKDFPVKFYAG